MTAGFSERLHLSAIALRTHVEQGLAIEPWPRWVGPAGRGATRPILSISPPPGTVIIVETGEITILTVRNVITDPIPQA